VPHARKALGEDLLPGILLHDLRHTQATLLLADGVPVKVVSERLGHASATITRTVFQHVHPGTGREVLRTICPCSAEARIVRLGSRGPWSFSPQCSPAYWPAAWS
jgi:hypothetical protein